MNVSIICPLYNAEKYIEQLNNGINMQENIDIKSVVYILTESTDKTEDLLKKLNLKFYKIKKEEFSHSRTREKIAMAIKEDIIVFITQDIIINNKLWLYNLVKDIENGSCDASFSRQVCIDNSIEKYIRENNYPLESRIVSKKDIEKLHIMTFFFSDASSAIRSDVFKELNGYDNKDLLTNEDMYIAYKLIMNGYKIKYCADSVIIHSHKFTYKQLFKRYYNIGKFFSQNKYLQKYKVDNSGVSLAKYVAKRAFEEKNYRVLFILIPNFAMRFIGMKFGIK